MSDNLPELRIDEVNDSLNSVFNGFAKPIGNENPLSKLYLNESDYNYLYERARIFQNMVNLIPEDSNLHYPQITSTEDDDLANIQQEMEAVQAIGEPLEPIDLKGAVTLCGIYARLYGDGFIFMGIRDGKDPSEPVDWNNVKGLDWVIVRSKYEVSLNQFRNTITNHGSGVNVSQLVGSDTTVADLNGVQYHQSRVFRMKGVSRHGTSLSTGQFNMSVIDGVYSDYTRYLKAIQNGSDMLASHSIFKFGMQGLSAKALKSSVAGALKSRFQNILDSIGILGGVMYDKMTEEVDYVSRSYSGVNDIMTHLKDWLVGNSGLPQNKLFGSAASNALSSQSEGEKEQWQEIIDRYRASEVLPFYRIVTKILSVSKKIDPNKVKVEFSAFYQRTDKEIAESNSQSITMFKTLMDTLLVARDAGIYTDAEVKEMLDFAKPSVTQE